MSVLTDIAEERELSAPATAVVLPCVNLLPPEVAQRKAFRQLQFRLAGLVVVAAGVVALVYTQVAGGVAPAQNRLDAARNQGIVLQRQIAGLSNVTQTRAEYEAAQAALSKIMGSDVRWSRYLNDLSITMPANVWVENLAVNETAATQTTTANPNGTQVKGTADTGLGTLKIQGKALSFNDVAVWLETLSKEKGYTDVWLAQGATQVIDGKTVVNFTSTVTFTPAVLSQRYTKRAGN